MWPTHLTMRVENSEGFVRTVPQDDAEEEIPDDELNALLSPSDGYFHTSSSSSTGFTRHPQHEQPGRLGVPSVPNLLVEDPTLHAQQRDAKHGEAADERRFDSLPNHSGTPSSSASVYQQTSPPAGNHRSIIEDIPSSPRSLSHQTLTPAPSTQPLLTAMGDAPPAYTARSPTRQPLGSHGGVGYQTFRRTCDVPGGARETPEGSLDTVPRRSEPVGGFPPDASRTPPSRWRRIRDSFKNGRFRGMLQKVLGTLLLVSIVLMLINSFMIRGSTKVCSDLVLTQWPSSKYLLMRPLLFFEKKQDPDFQWEHSRQCRDEPYEWPTTTSVIDFDPAKSLTIIQKTSEDRRPFLGRMASVSGDLILRPAVDKEMSSKLVVEIITNDPDLKAQQFIEEGDAQVIKILTPSKVAWPKLHHSPCIQLRLTLHVPPDSVLGGLEVDLTHINIRLVDGLNLALESKAVALSTVFGHVTAPDHEIDAGSSALAYRLSSREIKVHTVSGDITGWYPLYDLLELSTNSGTIETAVTIKPVDKQNPRKAVLNALTVSGDITVKELLDLPGSESPPVAREEEEGEEYKASEIYSRDCVVRMDTDSGSISAYVAIGSSSSFWTNSGSLDLTLAPVLDSRLRSANSGTSRDIAGHPISRLSTETKSGSINLVLKEVTWTEIPSVNENAVEVEGHPDDYSDNDPTLEESEFIPDSRTEPPSLGILASSHVSVSGSQTLSYPSSWTGHLRALTTSGSQDIRGDGLHVVRRSGMFPKIVEAWKGKGHSEVKLETVSGTQNFLVRSAGE